MLRQIVYSTIFSTLIMAVVLITPSSGLLTLTIPDETNSTAGAPDTQHIGKRAPDGSHSITIDMIAGTGSSHPQLPAVAAAAAIVSRSHSHFAFVLARIRAPPSYSVV